MGRSGEGISVNTDIIKKVTSEIRNINLKIQNDFSTVDIAMNSLSNNWSGYAKDSMFTKYKSFKNNYQNNGNRNRFSIIEHQMKYLDEIVSKGYEYAEKVNKDLSKNYSESIADLYN